MNVAVSSVPSSSSRSSSSSSSNRYSNINLTQHNNQQYPSTVSPYNSGSFMKHDLDVEIIASSPSPSSREHELSLLLQQERSKLSQCQHQLKDAETQTNIYMQKYQNISHEKNQFELHKSQIEDDLQSSRDELLFLRNQLHIKSGKISELETMLQQNQTSACINANTATATTDYKKLYDDAINENYLWAAKMDESERCIVELEDEKRVINDALFQWEAAFAQLETKMGGMAQKEEGMNERIVSLEISAAKYRNRSQGYMYAHKISCKKRLLSRCFDALRLRCYYKKLYVMQQQSDDINVTTQQTKAHNHLTDMSAPVSLVESEVAVLPPTSSESSTDIIQSSDELLRQLSFRLEHNTPNQTIRDRKISSLILVSMSIRIYVLHQPEYILIHYTPITASILSIDCVDCIDNWGLYLPDGA